jgi:YfiH family protein
VVCFRTTDRGDGDFAIDAEPSGLADRRRALDARPWVWLRQVHGADVVVVTARDVDEARGTEADALVTADPDVLLAVQTADCVPVVLDGDHGVVGIAHAGWRGIEAGVLDATRAAMLDLGATEVRIAAIGPHVMASCYEFGADDLDRLAERFGEGIRARTPEGAAALDLDEMIRSAWGDPVPSHGSGHDSCTACHPERWFSHRARGERERMATVVWRGP